VGALGADDGARVVVVVVVVVVGTAVDVGDTVVEDGTNVVVDAHDSVVPAVAKPPNNKNGAIASDNRLDD
jgi:hypothetical protein